MSRATVLRIVVAIVAMVAGLTVTGVPTEGQPKKVPRVGILIYGSPPPASAPEQAIIEALKELGWIDGQNMSLLIRFARAGLNGFPAWRALSPRPT